MNDYETTINTLKQLKNKLIEEHLIDILKNENEDNRYTIAIDNAICAINKEISIGVKQVPYFYGVNYHCSNCGNHIGAKHDDFRDVNYCTKRGQKITIKEQ
jgi:DNA-directed RNA polymerase subunit RPC12/RpoP